MSKTPFGRSRNSGGTRFGPLDERLLSAAVLVGSVLFLIAFWALAPAALTPALGTDYVNFYEPVAQNIANGHGIVTEAGIPATKYPPGHSLLLAPLFFLAGHLDVSPVRFLALFTMVNFGASALLLYWLGRALWGPLLAIGIPILWVTYVFALPLYTSGVDGRPLSEVTFITFLYASLLILWKAPHVASRWRSLVYLLLGAFTGYTMLIRPIAIGLLLVYPLALVWRSRETGERLVRTIGLFLIGTLLVIGPWEAWVFARTGTIIPLSTVGHSNAVDGLTSFAHVSKAYRHATVVPDDVDALMYRIEARASETETTGGLVLVLVSEGAAAPMAMTKLFLIKAARSWYATDSGRHERLTLAAQTIYIALIVAAIGLTPWPNYKHRYLLAVALLIVILFWLMNTAVLPVLRYMIPAMGLLFLFVPAIINPWLGRRTQEPPAA